MILNTFDIGEEGWCSYDYEKSKPPQLNHFVLAAWLPHSGIGNSGFIWSDKTRFSVDEPENPNSILALMFYARWAGVYSVRLKETTVSMYLRGFDMDLKGAECYFWIAGGWCSSYTRYHYKIPLHIEHGKWSDEPNTIVIPNDESLWHQSWRSQEWHTPLSLVLENTQSYGIAFVGFSEMVEGAIGMDNFCIR